MTKTNLLYFAALAFSLGWLFFNFLALPAPLDCGDGLVHFFISQASWYEPELFLDHWGKPFFILVSSPFAQLGFGGMILFNSLVFALTILFSWSILQKLKTPLAFQLALPFLLLLTPEYANTVLGGLTEPLFSLFIVLAAWAWMNERFFLFSIAIGLLPFMRSEGQLVILLAIVLLLLVKQWKYLLALAIPFLLYSIVGLFALDDFWWYFTQSPYSMDRNAYGIGSYFHYIKEYKQYLGLHGLLLFGLGILLGCYFLIRKQLEIKTIGLALLSYGTFLGIVAAHSYFYGSGQNSSMGLTRITTQGLPSFLLINLFFIGKLLENKNKWMQYGSFVLPGFLVLLLCTTPYLKKGENRMNNAVLSMGEFIQNAPDLRNQKIFAYHPLISYALESNLKIKRDRVQQFAGIQFLNEKNNLTYGDAVVWDSQFGDLEITISLEQMLKDTTLMLCHYEPAPGNQASNGVYLFQYVPAEVKRNGKTRLQEIPIAKKMDVSSKKEFHDLLKLDSSNDARSIQITCSGPKNVHFVCTSSDNSDYQGTELTDEKQTFEFVLEKGKNYNLYLWNPSLLQYDFSLFDLIEKKKQLPKLWGNSAKQ